MDAVGDKRWLYRLCDGTHNRNYAHPHSLDRATEPNWMETCVPRPFLPHMERCPRGALCEHAKMRKSANVAQGCNGRRQSSAKYGRSGSSCGKWGTTTNMDPPKTHVREQNMKKSKVHYVKYTISGSRSNLLCYSSHAAMWQTILLNPYGSTKTD